MKKNLAAQMLVSLRWKKTTKAERVAHGTMMSRASLGARKARKLNENGAKVAVDK